MICAVVLAAGRSERMGTQKLLLPLGGKPVIARIVDELSRSRVEEILVVTGHDRDRLHKALAGWRVQFVANPDPDSDMLHSVRCGLRALPRHCEAVFVVLGDQPGITRKLLDELIRCFRQNNSKIIVPTRDGHRGHPVLFSSQHFKELLDGYEHNGLRGFLNAHSKGVLRVPISDLNALDDMDTPADYQRQEKLFADRYADTVSPP